MKGLTAGLRATPTADGRYCRHEQHRDQRTGNALLVCGRIFLCVWRCTVVCGGGVMAVGASEETRRRRRR